MDRETVITHLQIIHTWASFARERDLQFFTAKHLEDIAQWADDALELLKEYDTQAQYRNDHIAEYEKEIKRLNKLLKEQEWNVLTEDADGIIHGLPGDDGQYLMTDGEDIWIDDYVDGVDDGVWLDSGRDVREIKAWMYMPKLPDLPC